MENTQLIKKCLKNSRSAQLQLYDKYCDGMFAIALRYVKQTDVAEDVMQEAFIKAFENLADFDLQQSFGAWLKRITINLAIDHYRQKKPESSIDDQVIQLYEDDATESWEVETHVTEQKVIKAIEDLPVKYATILKLFLLEGYDHEEISEILGISKVASRTLVHRGKKKLQEELKDLRHGTGY